MKLSLSQDELKYWVTEVTTEFYELVYQDPWFKNIFRNIKQEVITSQQIEFMIQSLGGPKMYCGRSPKDAHPQVWVNEEIWQYREDLLVKAFDKLKAPDELKVAWLKIDEAFKGVIINKAGPEECSLRDKADEIIYEPMPNYLKKAS
jgi:truncated hemoglobin YjbI